MIYFSFIYVCKLVVHVLNVGRDADFMDSQTI